MRNLINTKSESHWQRNAGAYSIALIMIVTLFIVTYRGV